MMPDEIMRVKLSELKTVRVRCKVCKHGVIEVPLDGLDRALNRQGCCHFCTRDIFPNASANPLNQLRLAIRDLERLKDDLQIEFDLGGTVETEG